MDGWRGADAGYVDRADVMQRPQSNAGVAKLMMRFHPSLDLGNYHGHTALDIARAIGADDVVAVMEREQAHQSRSASTLSDKN